MKQEHWLIVLVGIVGLGLGYFAGREHVKYEIRSAMTQTASAITEAFQGSSPPPTSSKSSGSTSERNTRSHDLIRAEVSNKRVREMDYREWILWDVNYVPDKLEKPARSVKGVLEFADLFGEIKFQVRTTIDEPIAPGKPVREEGVGIDYNQFMDDHRWLLTTELANIKVGFSVLSILYTDGTVENFD